MVNGRALGVHSVASPQSPGGELEQDPLGGLVDGEPDGQRGDADREARPRTMDPRDGRAARSPTVEQHPVKPQRSLVAGARRLGRSRGRHDTDEHEPHVVVGDDRRSAFKRLLGWRVLPREGGADADDDTECGSDDESTATPPGRWDTVEQGGASGTTDQDLPVGRPLRGVHSSTVRRCGGGEMKEPGPLSGGGTGLLVSFGTPSGTRTPNPLSLLISLLEVAVRAVWSVAWGLVDSGWLVAFTWHWSDLWARVLQRLYGSGLTRVSSASLASLAACRLRHFSSTSAR